MKYKWEFYGSTFQWTLKWKNGEFLPEISNYVIKCVFLRENKTSYTNYLVFTGLHDHFSNNICKNIKISSLNPEQLKHKNFERYIYNSFIIFNWHTIKLHFLFFFHFVKWLNKKFQPSTWVSSLQIYHHNKSSKNQNHLSLIRTFMSVENDLNTKKKPKKQNMDILND